MNFDDAASVAEYSMKKLSKIAESVVIGVEEKKEAQVKFSNSKVSTTQRWETTSIGVFAAIKKRVVSTEFMPDEDSADRAIRRMVEISRVVSPNPEHIGIAKGPFKYKGIKTYDLKMESMDMADIVMESINIAHSNGAERASGIFEKTISKGLLLTSGDVNAAEKSSRAYFSIRSMSGEGSGHNVSASRTAEGLNHVRAAKESACTAVLSRNPSGIPQGKYDVLFEHLPVANLMETVSGSASIFNVEAGLSFLHGKLGKKVASSLVNIYDDATTGWGISSRQFDDEGSPTRRTEIISKGVLRNFLHNTSTAKKYKTASTSNAGLVSPRALNPVFEKGNLNKEAMLGKMKRGLLVTNVWYTRFQNHATGEFSTIPRDGLFLVEAGKIRKPVKGLRISDNMLGILQRVASVGNDPEPVMSWELESPITVPSVLVKGVNFSKSVE